MAGELGAIARSGASVYAMLRNAAGAVWNGTAFEAYTDAHYATYPVLLVEQGGSGYYIGDAPSGVLAAPGWSYIAYLRVGATPAQGDVPVAQGGQIAALASIDHTEIQADVVAAIGATNIAALPFIVNLAPQTAKSSPATITPPLVPGTDRAILIQKGGLPTGKQLISATMELRIGNAPISGLADRVISQVANAMGQITGPGVLTGLGTNAVALLFLFTNAETALATPGTTLQYFVTATDNSNPGLIYELEQGTWTVLTGGPRG